jgi:hypothetical protein
MGREGSGGVIFAGPGGMQSTTQKPSRSEDSAAARQRRRPSGHDRAALVQSVQQSSASAFHSHATTVRVGVFAVRRPWRLAASTS